MASIPEFPSTIKTADLITVDYDLLSRGDGAEKTKLFEAARHQGFLYLKNHTVDPSPMFDLAAMFSLPVEEKMKYDMGTDGYYFGYKPRGSQYVDANGTPDTQEYYNISKDDLTGLRKDRAGHPKPVEDQRKKLEVFVENSHKTVLTILKAIGEQLGLDPELLPSMHKIDSPSGDHCRVTYTPAPPSGRKNPITFGGHTDFGSVTLLFNRLGGLQVVNPGDTKWIYVKPAPGCVIINFGDSIVKLLGGKIHSGLHRVVSPPGDQASLTRVSVVYFSRPNSDVPLKSLIPGVDLHDEVVLTADEWIKHRAVHRNTNNYKGKESFLQSKGTEHRSLDQEPAIEA